MSGDLYRSLHLLYPREFRRGYGDDLVAFHQEFAAERGAVAAWRRTVLDLLITVPRYRLESVMSQSRSTTALTVSLVVLVAGGIMSVLIGLYPGVALLGVALVLGVAQRSQLARSIRTPSTDRRRRRLTIALVLAVVTAVSMVSYLHAVGDGHVSTASLLIHNAIGVPAMIGTVGYLIVGLLTPKSPGRLAGIAQTG